MRLGAGLPVSGAWATPDNVQYLARRAEDLGYDSVWAFQRLLHPIDHDWGSAYHAVLDPVTTLAFAAAHTKRIRLGVAVVNLPYYSPIVLSKALTTVDVLSQGRLDVGLGLGWAKEEFAAVGAPMERRGPRAVEFIDCLKTIWSHPEVEFHGEFYDIPRSHIDPKPVQRPHPPLLMGGGVDAALRRIGRIADGWISSSRTDLATIGSSVDIIKQSAAEAGRDPDLLRFVVRGVVRLLENPPNDRSPLQGTVDQIRGDLDALSRQGVTEVFFDLNWDEQTVADGTDPEAAQIRADEILTRIAPAT